MDEQPNWCPNCERETDWLIDPSQPNIVRCKECGHLKIMPGVKVKRTSAKIHPNSKSIVTAGMALTRTRYLKYTRACIKYLTIFFSLILCLVYFTQVCNLWEACRWDLVRITELTATIRSTCQIMILQTLFYLFLALTLASANSEADEAEKDFANQKTIDEY